MSERAAGGWRFFVDRGGTFTDVIGIDPRGVARVAKIPSSETAAVEGIRALLARAGESEAAARCARIGTTLATNALLQRRGAPALLITQQGLGDVFVIRTQERPELFALRIERPPPLHARTIEVAGRDDVQGREIARSDEAALDDALRRAREDGIESVAVALLHATLHPARERELAERARAAGFAHVVASHEIASEAGLLARGETAIVDAYLTPLLRRHAQSLATALPGVALSWLQSSGGLVGSERFRGPHAILSGPAGGAVGAARVAATAGEARAIGFDMGGTSTDVCWIADGAVEPRFETEIAGLCIVAPSVRVHSVAAGGGSICRFDGVRFRVGPESAGADPGPICYARRAASGERLARELTLTDLDVALGRLPVDALPFPLDRAAVERALDAMVERVREAGHVADRESVAAGFLRVANEAMADAIRRVTVERGADPRGAALVAFGGAAGQHACAVARLLGVRRVLVHPLASVLSAYGIGLAPRSAELQRDLAGLALTGHGAPSAAQRALEEMEACARATLRRDGAHEQAIAVERALDLRALGTERALRVIVPADGDLAGAFDAEHRRCFGWSREGRPLEIVTARVRAVAATADGITEQALAIAVAPSREAGAAPDERELCAPAASRGDTARDAVQSAAPEAAARARFFVPGAGFCEAPRLRRDSLAAGARVAGPALVLDPTTTLVVEPGFVLEVAPDGLLVLTDEQGAQQEEVERELERPDPVRLEVLGHRFATIAEQMGAVLRQTAVSTNIKERRDFSCAVFDADGGLVANAPHIPVHLGAMGDTVRAVKRAFPDLAAGDAVVTNDPAAGGSHLPDVTVVAPVLLPGRTTPDLFVACRGHHAEIGGKTPGSMPAGSRTLEEEGVLLPPMRFVHAGRLDEAGLRARLAAGPFPSRSPDDNVADLEAMVAACRGGERWLHELVRERGAETVLVTMAQLQRAASSLVERAISRLPAGEHGFADALDDGTRIRATLRREGTRLRVDFTGTGAAVESNLNAPPSVVRAAVLYVLRCWIDAPIPLNGGCLAPIDLVIPPGSLLDPPPGRAVVGGNVETSQRIVDVLLAALGLAAASQGTMNNLTLGDATFGYYETIGGGAGAGPGFDGASGVHVHMTNTRITDPEILERRHPLRLRCFALRRGSGGSGRWRGGDGIVRAIEALAPLTASLLCERRVRAPFGCAGGRPGAPGAQRVVRASGRVDVVEGRAMVALDPGDVLWIETPGGGGFGDGLQ